MSQGFHLWILCSTFIHGTIGMTNVALFASSVIRFSSQPSDSSYHAEQILGDKDKLSWRTDVCDANQYIELQFNQHVKIEQMEVYELVNPGGLKRISVLNPTCGWDAIYTAETLGDTGTNKRTLIPTLDTMITYFTDTIRMDVNCTAIGTYVGYDAVKITGPPFTNSPEETINCGTASTSTTSSTTSSSTTSTTLDTGASSSPTTTSTTTTTTAADTSTSPIPSTASTSTGFSPDTSTSTSSSTKSTPTTTTAPTPVPISTVSTPAEESTDTHNTDSIQSTTSTDNGENVLTDGMSSSSRPIVACRKVSCRGIIPIVTMEFSIKTLADFKKNTAKLKRKKICAPDNRMSSQTIGGMALVVIVVPIVLLVACDVAKVIAMLFEPI